MYRSVSKKWIRTTTTMIYNKNNMFWEYPASLDIVICTINFPLSNTKGDQNPECLMFFRQSQRQTSSWYFLGPGPFENHFEWIGLPNKILVNILIKLKYPNLTAIVSFLACERGVPSHLKSLHLWQSDNRAEKELILNRAEFIWVVGLHWPSVRHFMLNFGFSGEIRHHC